MSDEAVHDESAIVAGRQYDAGVDLHDSYYAAVAELRQQHEAGLPADQRALKVRQIKRKAIIDVAARLKDWILLADAVDAEIEDQAEFVRWWNETVTGARHNVNPTAENAERRFLGRPEAEAQTEITQQQVSRWRKSLRDAAKYREQMIAAARRKADLAAAANHRAEGTGENEWFTPAQYVEAARDVMGEIDLDPASHPIAQETVQAFSYYTAADDGLVQPWHGRVWLNPPYVQPLIAQFAAKMVDEVTARRVTQAIMLTHNYTDTAWFHQAEAAADLICFTRGRIKFVDIDGDDCAPTQGQAFFYYGPHGDRFRDVFSQFGFVR
jgi:phage N-6-adenine-methyltransferase